MRKQWVIVGSCLAGLALVAAGFLAYRMLTLRQQPQESATEGPSETESASTPPAPSSEPSTVRPTAAPVTIPDDWVEFTDTDAQARLTVTLSVPPGYSFRFTGSEWTLSKFNDENWDYFSSIFFDRDGKPYNSYQGGSRRSWYQQYLNDEFFFNTPPVIRGEIVSVEEKPLGQSSYLEIGVQNPFYDRVETHYLYAHNGMLHVIKPQSGKALSSDSLIADNVDVIFTSLESSFGD